jgi:high-affinity iron transporter
MKKLLLATLLFGSSLSYAQTLQPDSKPHLKPHLKQQSSKQSPTPKTPPTNLAEKAETLRQQLSSAQLDLVFDPQSAKAFFAQAESLAKSLADSLVQNSGVSSLNSFTRSFTALEQALNHKNELQFASERAKLWTSLLKQSNQKTLEALSQNDLPAFERWFALRDYRQASRFVRPQASGTEALEAFKNHEISTTVALERVRADLLDGYQARLNEVLQQLPQSQKQGYTVQVAELASLASGYFAILQSTYLVQRGPAQTKAASLAFSQLEGQARNKNADLTPALNQVSSVLQGFRAAPLSSEELSRRTGQLNRFLKLVAVEYARGVDGQHVKKQLEVQEALTFGNGALSAYLDLKSTLESQYAGQHAGQQQSQAAQIISHNLKQITTALEQAYTGEAVLPVNQLQTKVQDLQNLLEQTLPAAWQQGGSGSDLEVIASILDQMETASKAGNLELAESARLEAYATLESGSEAKLRYFDPELALRIEGLFWNGIEGDGNGLAKLIAQNKPSSEILAVRQRLDREFKGAAKILGTETSATAVATNAGVLVFREGLEAVLILAALMASFKRPENRHLRKPLWAGAAAAFAFSGLTWWAMQGLLSQFAKYGEKLEAVVSVLAIVVLLVIMNWFFHNIYWTGQLSKFHQQKQGISKRDMGQAIGLVVLGFTSVYREGFETVLFLQSLVLQAGNATVLLGTAIGLALVGLIGWIIFALQTKLPHKKMLSATGLMICMVLFMMVGNTTHVLQLVGWFPIHPVAGVHFPYWLSQWFGLFPTWEGLILQVLAPIMIIGSYFAAESLKRVKLDKRIQDSKANA